MAVSGNRVMPMRFSEVAAKAFLFSVLAWVGGVAMTETLVKYFSRCECQEEKEDTTKEKEDTTKEEEDGFRRQLQDKDKLSANIHTVSVLLQKEDMISQLPDKILASIISRLTIKEAVRTSILSKRWRHVYAFMPALRFPCLFMFRKGCSHNPPAWANSHRDTFIKVVDHMLRLYSGRKVVSLQIDLCFVTECISDFEQWMRAIARMGIEDLKLRFPTLDADGCHTITNEYSFPLQLISEASASLEHLHLCACNLVLTPKCQFNSLKTLTLNSVILHSGQFQSILTSCLNLEKFKIEYGDLPPKLSIYSPHQLKFLSMTQCGGAKEIDICAPNLITFEYSSRYMVKLFLSHVPKLRMLDLYLGGKSTAPYVFCELAKDLEHLDLLSFCTCTDKLEYIDAGRNMFRNLRQLYLVCWHHREFDLMNVTPILGACALLEKFQLAAYDLGWYQRSPSLGQIFNTMLQTIIPRSDDEDGMRKTCIAHKHLKEVTFGGFHGTRNEIEVAKFVLRSAVVLDRMVISNSFKFYAGDGRYSYHCGHPFGKKEREMFNRELQGQAVSSTAKLIIDCPRSML